MKRKMLAVFAGIIVFIVVFGLAKLLEGSTENRDMQAIMGFLAFGGLVVGYGVYRWLSRPVSTDK